MSFNYEEFLKEKYNKTSLSVKEVAEELNLTPRMISERVRGCSAEIPAFKRVGGRTLFPLKQVAYFLEHDFIKAM